MNPKLWLAITPGPLLTRVVGLDATGAVLLQAQLPHGPCEPRAVSRLCEALALWCGRPAHVVLAVAGPGAFCATRPWLSTFEELTRPALYELEFAPGLLAPDDERGFADVVQMLRARMRR